MHFQFEDPALQEKMEMIRTAATFVEKQGFGKSVDALASAIPLLWSGGRLCSLFLKETRQLWEDKLDDLVDACESFEIEVKILAMTRMVKDRRGEALRLSKQWKLYQRKVEYVRFFLEHTEEGSSR